MPVTPSNAKKPKDHKEPKAKKYGQKTWGVKFHDLTVPSGELVQVRRPGLQGLLKAGILESMDGLTGMVQSETIPKAQGKPVVIAKDILKDKSKMEDMLAAIDKIVLHVVVQPELRPAIVTQEMIDAEDSPFDAELLNQPVPYELRDEDAIYVDYVDIEDKTFIMQFAMGGSADLATFRKESKEVVASLSDVEAAPEDPERAVQD